MIYRVAWNFCGLAIFCALRELIFAIRTAMQIGFYPVPSIDNIFVFIEYVE